MRPCVHRDGAVLRTSIDEGRSTCLIAGLGGSSTVEMSGATLAELYARRAEQVQVRSGQAPVGGRAVPVTANGTG